MPIKAPLTAANPIYSTLYCKSYADTSAACSLSGNTPYISLGLERYKPPGQTYHYHLAKVPELKEKD